MLEIKKRKINLTYKQNLKTSIESFKIVFSNYRLMTIGELKGVFCAFSPFFTNSCVFTRFSAFLKNYIFYPKYLCIKGIN
jgi:hypothetical protein